MRSSVWSGPCTAGLAGMKKLRRHVRDHRAACHSVLLTQVSQLSHFISCPLPMGTLLLEQLRNIMDAQHRALAHGEWNHTQQTGPVPCSMAPRHTRAVAPPHPSFVLFRFFRLSVINSSSSPRPPCPPVVQPDGAVDECVSEARAHHRCECHKGVSLGHLRNDILAAEDAHIVVIGADLQVGGDKGRGRRQGDKAGSCCVFPCTSGRDKPILMVREGFAGSYHCGKRGTST